MYFEANDWIEINYFTFYLHQETLWGVSVINLLPSLLLEHEIHEEEDLKY